MGAGASDGRAARIGQEEREIVDLRGTRMISSRRDAIYWQGRPAEEDAVLGHPPNDPPARSRNAPRGRSPSQMWLPKLGEKKEEEGGHPRGRERGRAQNIKEQCMTGNEASERLRRARQRHRCGALDQANGSLRNVKQRTD